MSTDWRQIETEVEIIDRDIRLLERKRLETLCRDPEYAAYLDACDDHAIADPLSISLFHRYDDELGELGKKFDAINAQADPDAFDRVWRENCRRMVELERLLLA